MLRILLSLLPFLLLTTSFEARGGRFGIGWGGCGGGFVGLRLGGSFWNSGCFPVCKCRREYFVPSSATNETSCRMEAEGEDEDGGTPVTLTEGDFCKNQTLLEVIKNRFSTFSF